MKNKQSVVRLRGILFTLQDGSQRKQLFSHPYHAEYYLLLIPQLQVAGNKEVEGVCSAKLIWENFGNG